ncbi:hypothetical protein SNK03_008880 [Fusarium graminearum]
MHRRLFPFRLRYKIVLANLDKVILPRDNYSAKHAPISTSKFHGGSYSRISGSAVLASEVDGVDDEFDALFDYMVVTAYGESRQSEVKVMALESVEVVDAMIIEYFIVVENCSIDQ